MTKSEQAKDVFLLMSGCHNCWHCGHVVEPWLSTSRLAAFLHPECLLKRDHMAATAPDAALRRGRKRQITEIAQRLVADGKDEETTG